MVSGALVRCEVPSGSVGAVGMRVANGGAESLESIPLWVEQPANTALLGPLQSDVDGGALVEVQVSGLSPSAQATCRFGTVSGVAARAVASNVALCVAPARPAGSASLAISGNNQDYVVVPAAFAYIEAPPQDEPDYSAAAALAAAAEPALGLGPVPTAPPSPASGASSGGDLVTVAVQGGAALSAGSLGCRFGSIGPVAARFPDSFTLDCASPAHAAGSVPAGVLGAEAFDAPTAGPFAFLPSPPEAPESPLAVAAQQAIPLEPSLADREPAITGVDPARGPAEGGVLLAISGGGFSAQSACRLGSTGPISARLTGLLDLECMTAAHAPGPAPLSVGSGIDFPYLGWAFDFLAGASPGLAAAAEKAASLEQQLAVDAAGSSGPLLLSLAPAEGPLQGGTLLAVAGLNFVRTAPLACRIGTAWPILARQIDSTLLECSSTSHAAGPVPVFAAADAQSTPHEALVFTYSIGADEGGADDSYAAVLPLSPPTWAEGPRASPPVLISLSPSSGLADGGTSVAIAEAAAGQGGLQGCRFGSTGPISGKSLGPTDLACLAPAHLAATVPVAVYDGSGLSSNRLFFEYVAAEEDTPEMALSPAAAGPPALADAGVLIAAPALPVVSMASPGAGPSAGGTVVAVSGKGFSAGSPWLAGFVGTVLVAAAYVSSEEISLVTPAQAPAVVEIRARVLGPLFGPETATFVYSAAADAPVEPEVGGGAVAAALATVWPSFASIQGGAHVTVAGSGFATDMTCSFGSGRATAAVVVSSGLAVCQTSAVQSAGMAALVVALAGSSAGGGSAPFFFTKTAQVTGISPGGGSAGGGDLVSLGGGGFSPSEPYFARFGTVAPVEARWASDGSLQLVSPAHAPATVPVWVAVSLLEIGTSSVGFTFFPPASSLAAEDAAAPRATGVPLALAGAAPLLGWAGGGTVVFVSSSLLPTGGLACAFGATSSTSARAVSSALVTCETPLASSGSLVLRLEGAEGASEVGMGFLVTSSQAILSVEPAAGPPSGGTLITLHASHLGLANDLACRVGTVAPIAASLSGPDELQCISPARAAGSSEVALTLNLRDYTDVEAFLFAGALDDAAGPGEQAVAEAAPKILSISPQTVPAGQGTLVLVRGADFAPSISTCLFGGVEGALAFISSAIVVCEAPQSAAPKTVALSFPTGPAEVDFWYTSPISVRGLSPPGGASDGATSVDVSLAGVLGAAASWCRFGSIGPVAAQASSATVRGGNEISITFLGPASSLHKFLPF